MLMTTWLERFGQFTNRQTGDGLGAGIMHSALAMKGNISINNQNFLYLAVDASGEFALGRLCRKVAT
jgi:hypothetical protein